MNNCVFCNLPNDRIINEYKHFYVIRDLYPVTHLHSLVIPKRHIVSYFECNQDEYNEIPIVLSTQKTELTLTDETINGFNILMKIREDAGQTVFHFNIHVITRRKADAYNPRGGVREFIQYKQGN